MTKSKFTKGPWEAHGPTVEGNASRRVFAGTAYLGTVSNSDMSIEEIAANAELWADAPALLEVLRKVLTYAESSTRRQYLDEADQTFVKANELLEKHGG
jgi:hypothetical protein